MNREYKPLNMFVKQTDELKELIKKYPDYPIVVLVGNEVVPDYGFRWWYAPDLEFKIAEILDCKQDVDEMKVYTDRDEFEEDLINLLSLIEEYENLSNEEFKKIVKAELQKYEKYWKTVIAIYADV